MLWKGWGVFHMSFPPELKLVSECFISNSKIRRCLFARSNKAQEIFPMFPEPQQMASMSYQASGWLFPTWLSLQCRKIRSTLGIRRITAFLTGLFCLLITLQACAARCAYGDVCILPFVALTGQSLCTEGQHKLLACMPAMKALLGEGAEGGKEAQLAFEGPLNPHSVAGDRPLLPFTPAPGSAKGSASSTAV